MKNQFTKTVPILLLFNFSGHGIIDLGFFAGELKDFELSKEEECRYQECFEKFPKGVSTSWGTH